MNFASRRECYKCGAPGGGGGGGGVARRGGADAYARARGPVRAQARGLDVPVVRLFQLCQSRRV